MFKHFQSQSILFQIPLNIKNFDKLYYYRSNLLWSICFSSTRETFVFTNTHFIHKRPIMQHRKWFLKNYWTIFFCKRKLFKNPLQFVLFLKQCIFFTRIDISHDIHSGQQSELMRVIKIQNKVNTLKMPFSLNLPHTKSTGTQLQLNNLKVLLKRLGNKISGKGKRLISSICALKNWSTVMTRVME